MSAKIAKEARLVLRKPNPGKFKADTQLLSRAPNATHNLRAGPARRLRSLQAT
jgi:hypothetical protein